MAAKARRSRGKHTAQVKKKKGRKAPQAIDRPGIAAPADRPAIAPIPATAPPATAPPAKVPAPVIESPGLTNELVRIGILFAIMLTVLIVLALVLG